MMSNNELKKTDSVQRDAWQGLKNYTRARIALGNAGGSLPTAEVLSFQMAHAHAKDAVYTTLHTEALLQQLQALHLPLLTVCSKATGRAEYLKRPDLGRCLSDEDAARLAALDMQADIVLVIADGLSAGAVNKYAFELLRRIYELLKDQYTAAVLLVQQGRVAIGDEVGELLRAKMSIVLIGERPGLTTPESMGIYTTWAPQKGLTDERRNCISNIHDDGLGYEQATQLLHYLVTESFKRQESGVALKPDVKPSATGMN